MQYKPPKIEDIGLKNYLNQTKHKHNDCGYDEFVKRYELNEPKTVMARAFSVDRLTINKWIVIYLKEINFE